MPIALSRTRPTVSPSIHRRGRLDRTVAIDSSNMWEGGTYYPAARTERFGVRTVAQPVDQYAHAGPGHLRPRHGVAEGPQNREQRAPKAKGQRRSAQAARRPGARDRRERLD